MPQLEWQSKFMTPSRVDSFREYLNNDYEWEFESPDGEVHRGDEWTMELLIKKLLGIRRPRHHVADAGNAFHSLLERSRVGDSMIVEYSDDWEFHFELEESIYLAPIREIMFVGNVGFHKIRAKCDAVDGISIQDIKISSKGIDYNKFYDSYQWRLYLLMSNRRNFLYHIFKLKFHEDQGGNLLNKIVQVKDYYPIDLYAYPTMKNDCLELLNYYYQILTEQKELVLDIATKNNIKITGLNKF